MKRLPLIVHTLYAELVDLIRADAQSPWPLNGGLVKVRQEGQEYWYFQKSIRTSPGKYQRRLSRRLRRFSTPRKGMGIARS
jgi:hypothetical protein